MDEKDRLISWLSDAHAMEVELLPILRDHAEDARGFPELRSRIDQHLGETERQAERLNRALGILGASRSTIKSALASLIGGVMAPSTAFFSDEIVKNAMMDYATEQFEIAAHVALITAAEDLGEREVADLCRENLDEEEEMGRWLLKQLPATVRATLAGDRKSVRR